MIRPARLPGLVLVLLACVWGVFACGGASPDAPSVPLETILAFEGPNHGGLPYGWGGGPPETLHADSLVVHGGRWSVRLERDANSSRNFSSVTRALPVDFMGATLTLTGYLRTEGVTGYAGLWMREDGESGPPLYFDNMRSHGLKGTTPWTEHTISLLLHPQARSLVFGALVSGEGTLWVDDLQVLVDGKPVSQARKTDRGPTVLDADTEFDDGSGITLTRLSPVQAANLSVLCRVWGFLKYHHPRITGGGLHWDYELFRVLPRVLAAEDSEAGKRALAAWVRSIGAPPPCAPCAALPDSALFQADVAWIHDRAVLGEDLAAYLESVYANRHADGPQFYVDRLGAGNPMFVHEPAYPEQWAPDAGYRILAFFRFWNIIQYWFPYRDVISANPGETPWADVPGEFLPRLVAAADADAYQLELIALAARVHDTHCNLWGSLHLRPPTGLCRLPVALRFIAGEPVVTGYASPEGAACGLKIGDVIETLDGRPVSDRLPEWTPYYAASNAAARLRDVARSLTEGPCGPCDVTGRRAGGPFAIRPERAPSDSLDPAAGLVHDRPGPAFQRLSPDVAYLKLSAVEKDHGPDYVEAASGTRGLVIDIRNYPSAFMVFNLGERLVSEPRDFVRFSSGDMANPGAFVWHHANRLDPQPPHYAGKVVILVDEATQSSAEYTAMAFRAVPGAVVVGSTTAGADGNVSDIPLPGGYSAKISGIGVYYPDGTPTQRVGIVPDVTVRPTVEGIRAGRDEVLEEGLRQILGGSVSEEAVRKMASRRP